MKNAGFCFGLFTNEAHGLPKSKSPFKTKLLNLHNISLIRNALMTKQNNIRFSANIAIISGAFALLVAFLLLLNYWQLHHNDPIESEALKSLVQRLSDDPKNQELKEDLRNLDLLARKAYFSSLWQIKTGSWLLLIASIVFVVALRFYFSLKSEIPLPEQSHQNENIERVLSHKWLLAVSLIILLLAVLAGFKSKNYFEIYESKKQIVADIHEYPEIEIIEIAEENSNTIIKVSEKDNFNNDSALPVKPEVRKKEMSEEKKSEEKRIEPEENIETIKKERAPVFPTISEIKKQHNCFRGPLGQGISYAKNIPTDWDGVSGKNVIWKVNIPVHGYNSPIIWGDKVMLAGGNKKTRLIYCYSKDDGSLLWQHKVTDIPGSPAKTPKTTDDTGLSAPGLTTDGQRVYGFFGNGDIVCLDLDGNRLWAKNLGVPDNHYGHSSSLICWKEKLFVQYDTNKGGKVFALNVLTGDFIWQVKRNCRISWASPILAKINGDYQLILSSNPIVAGYNIETGSEIWSVKCLMGEVGPSPAFADGIIYAANEYAKLIAIDSDNSYKTLWEDNEYMPEVSSPAVSEGLLFIATSYGVFACYDAKTGEFYWEHESPNGFYGSPMIVEGKVYTLDMEGIMYIMEVSKKFNLIAQPEIGEETTTTPAFSNGRIFIRTNISLYCIGKK
ncbi:MAG: PQQ-binding-like beta-propeller repeat protein [Bacteroidota bacterium]|nr:PQQ-binding-like beta-propeller repeat protein [Bacteroidota bacterium]